MQLLCQYWTFCLKGTCIYLHAGDRLNDVHIHVTDNFDFNNAALTMITQLPMPPFAQWPGPVADGANITLWGDVPAEGRYVIVHNAGGGDFLTLCEVQVMAKGKGSMSS